MQAFCHKTEQFKLHYFRKCVRDVHNIAVTCCYYMVGCGDGETVIDLVLPMIFETDIKNLTIFWGKIKCN